MGPNLALNLFVNSSIFTVSTERLSITPPTHLSYAHIAAIASAFIYGLWYILKVLYRNGALNRKCGWEIVLIGNFFVIEQVALLVLHWKYRVIPCGVAIPHEWTAMCVHSDKQFFLFTILDTLLLASAGATR